MESDTYKSMTLRDAETMIGGDNVSSAIFMNSISSSVNINSLSINLGIVKGKDDPQKCSHFSIRGYVAKMRERGGNKHLPFCEDTDIEVPRFRYWLCQSCLKDYGGATTSKLVYGDGKISMMQPSSHKSSSDCHGLPIVLSFGEGTSGIKPVDERINGDESIDTSQSSPKLDSRDATVVDDLMKTNECLMTFLPVKSTEFDRQNQDPSGHPRRKARKVRLLTELLCENQRKESKKNKKKRKDWRPAVDHVTTSQGHVSKKVKVVKGDIVAAVKTNIVEGESGQNTECQKHGPEKGSKVTTDDPVAAWRSIFSEMGRCDQGKQNDPLFSEKRCYTSNKVIMRNELFGDDNVGDFRARGGQGQCGLLGLGLSLNYEPQYRVPLPNRNKVPIQDHYYCRKDGFYFGESKGRSSSVYYNNNNNNNGHTFEHTHGSGSFSQHHNLDFSDPHNKRLNGYSDVTMTHNHQTHDIYSNGRSDETEIIQLMAKIQYERNLSGEASRNYNSSNHHQLSGFNQYPTIRRPPSSTMPTMENSFLGPTTMRNPYQLSHPSPIPDKSQYHENNRRMEPGNVWSNMEMHVKWSNRNNKTMNLDLNTMAPNTVEDHNNHSYSNDQAIPAMQLLSLMDAGKKTSTSSSSPFMNNNKKPFSCYNGMQSSVQRPVENSRNFNLGHGHSLPVTGSFSSFFRTDQIDTNGKMRDSFGFPLSCHASEGGSKFVTSETEICTINQNPADFSTPGPENVYMIDVENLKFRGNPVFYPREVAV